MNTTQEMLETHPHQQHINKEMFAQCITECFDCAQACTLCADACLSEQGYDALVRCIRLNLICADVCLATGRVLARPVESELALMRLQLQACEVACRVCAEECERHVHHEHCQVCARACRRCESACREMLAQLPQ